MNRFSNYRTSTDLTALPDGNTGQVNASNSVVCALFDDDGFYCINTTLDTLYGKSHIIGDCDVVPYVQQFGPAVIQLTTHSNKYM